MLELYAIINVLIYLFFSWEIIRSHNDRVQEEDKEGKGKGESNGTGKENEGKGKEKETQGGMNHESI